MPARSLSRIWKAVSGRDRPSCRWNRTGEMPGVWLDTKKAAQNHVLDCVCVRPIAGPAVKLIFNTLKRQGID